jgi:hypothetical protein
MTAPQTSIFKRSKHETVESGSFQQPFHGTFLQKKWNDYALSR